MSIATPICALHWFRQDLRLADNPGLTAAANSGLPLVALYVLDDATPGAWRLGGAARWWLHQSLTELTVALARHGVRLVLRRGPAARVVPDVARALGARLLTWNRVISPHDQESERLIASACAAAGVAVARGNASLLFEPEAVVSGSGGSYRVFTPFWRRARSLDPGPSLPAPPRLTASGVVDLAADALAEWRLLPRAADWATGFGHWRPGEGGAAARLQDFLDGGLKDYASRRDALATGGTSRLSPHLHWGEIGPRQVWQAVRRAEAAEKFLSELAWREFAHHLLHHDPAAVERNQRRRFDALAWRDDPVALRAWRQGRTGVPIVDAGMRELWASGWMHNRARMIVASFLTKHLLIDWREGARWFWDTLVDADLANNTLGWQWVAGTGTDAQPFVRVFNPVLQGARFDPQGDYVRRWVPELAHLPTSIIHAPWVSGSARAVDYPPPIVELAEGRARALAAHAALGGGLQREGAAKSPSPPR